MASIFTLPWADIGAGIKPADGALLNFYDTGTYNRRDTYTDSGAGTPHSNPVVADASGVFPAIYLDGTYRVVLTDKNAVQYEEEDGILSNAGDVATNTANIATNTADIATNTDAIAANSAAVLLSKSISGLGIANGTDVDHDIDISTGSCADSANGAILSLTSAMTKKLDSGWASGDASGGLFSGSIAADTTYHVFLIEKTSDGSIDAGFDTSVIAANIPSGYIRYRRIGSIVTDSSSNILGFYQAGDYFGLNDRILELNTSSPTTSGVLLSMSSPLGLEVIADLSVQLTHTATADLLITSPSETDSAASATNNTLRVLSSGTNNNTKIQKMTNASSQIRYRSDVSSVSNVSVWLEGWTDYRG